MSSFWSGGLGATNSGCFRVLSLSRTIVRDNVKGVVMKKFNTKKKRCSFMPFLIEIFSSFSYESLKSGFSKIIDLCPGSSIGLE